MPLRQPFPVVSCASRANPRRGRAQFPDQVRPEVPMAAVPLPDWHVRKVATTVLTTVISHRRRLLNVGRDVPVRG